MPIIDIFERLVAQGKTIVLATHDLHTTRTWAGRVIVMDGGRVVADGPTQHIFRDPATLERTSLNVVMGNLEQA